MKILIRYRNYILFFIIILLVNMAFNLWLDPPGGFPRADALDYIPHVIILAVIAVISFLLMLFRILTDFLKRYFQMGR